jgi:hypothetical protein
MRGIGVIGLTLSRNGRETGEAKASMPFVYVPLIAVKTTELRQRAKVAGSFAPPRYA